MASTVVIKATNVCSGGGHATITLSGDISATFRASFDAVENELGDLSPERILAAVVKVAALTRTMGQVKTALASAPGLTVTV